MWELTVPQRPDDRVTKLNYQRMIYGLSLIFVNREKEEQFIAEYVRLVPGPDLWAEAENLVGCTPTVGR